jgi:hypothetical protein
MVQPRRALISAVAALALFVGGISAFGAGTALAAKPTAPNPNACANSQAGANASANAHSHASANSAVHC